MRDTYTRGMRYVVLLLRYVSDDGVIGCASIGEQAIGEFVQWFDMICGVI